MSESNELKRMRDALQKAAAKFREYALIHRAKGTPEGDIKADQNLDMAVMLRDACRPEPVTVHRQGPRVQQDCHGFEPQPEEPMRDWTRMAAEVNAAWNEMPLWWREAVTEENKANEAERLARLRAGKVKS